MSSGRTESAENAWGASVDYLVPVDSSYDVYAPKYMEDVRYEKDVLRNKLETAFEGVTLGDDMTSWLSIGQVSDSGTVLTATVGDKTVSGNDVRTALSLRSPCFEVKFDGDAAVITTKGYGHGVGRASTVQTQWLHREVHGRYPLALLSCLRDSQSLLILGSC